MISENHPVLGRFVPHRLYLTLASYNVVNPGTPLARFFHSFARVPHGTLNLSYATRYHEPCRGTLAIERVLPSDPPVQLCPYLPRRVSPRRLKARLDLTISEGYRTRVCDM